MHSKDLQYKTAEPVSYTINSAAVLDNTGGKLTVDTASLLGSLETTSVVYPDSSKIYLDVKKFNGLDVKVGDKVASTGHVRLSVTVDSNLTTFTVGNRLYRIVNDGQDTDSYGIITEYDSVNNYIYYVPVEGTIGSGDSVGDYSATNVTLVGKLTVNGDLSVAGALLVVFRKFVMFLLIRDYISLTLMEPLVEEMVSEEEMIIDLQLLVKKFLKQGLRDSLRDLMEFKPHLI